MQSIRCQKHKLKKDFVFCLEDGCQDRLICKKCYVIDKQHNDHQCIFIEYFMQNDQDELLRLFNETYAEIIKHEQNQKQFGELLDVRFDKFMDEREECIRLPFEKMISDYRMSLQRYKEELCQKYNVGEVKNIKQMQQSMQQLIDSDSSQQKQKDMKDTVDSCKQIISIQNQLDLMLKQIKQDDELMADGIQQVINKYKMKYNVLFKYDITNNLTSAKQLQQCTQITIISSNAINDYKSQIKQYQQKGTQFKIYLEFYTITDPKQRKKIVEMIEQSNANDRVAEIAIRITNDNKDDIQSLENMVINYTSSYLFYIHIYADQIDKKTQGLLVELLKKRTVLTLYINIDSENIGNDDDELNLLKQINQNILKDKDYLERLNYSSAKINKNCSSKQSIKELIDQVANM